jgi:small-conductance mechanosensitive channel
MDSLLQYLSEEALRQLALAGGTVIVAAVLARLLMFFVDRIVLRFTGRTGTTLDDLLINALRTPLFWIVFLIGIQLGVSQLAFLDDAWRGAFEGILFLAFVLAGYILLYRLLNNLLIWYGTTLALRTETTIDEQIVPFVRRIVQGVLLAIALTIVLDHFGFNISGLVATLGVGSLAIALAAQAFLADTIAGFIIALDHPFSVGDRLQLPQSVMGEYGDWGDVAEIGLRSTRIRSVDGVLLTVPNSKLTNEVVINFSHSESPNLRVRVRVAVEPDLDNVQRAVREIARIAAQNPHIARAPREPQVVLREIEEYDVLVELRFYVDDARKMRTTKSEVIEEVLRRFEEEGIELATPTQVVQLEQPASQAD